MRQRSAGGPPWGPQARRFLSSTGQPFEAGVVSLMRKQTRKESGGPTQACRARAWVPFAARSRAVSSRPCRARERAGGRRSLRRAAPQMRREEKQSRREGLSEASAGVRELRDGAYLRWSHGTARG